jgi:hypothetical protein
MILGTDFLQKNEACLNWQNNTLSLRQNTVYVNIIPECTFIMSSVGFKTWINKDSGLFFIKHLAATKLYFVVI